MVAWRMGWAVGLEEMGHGAGEAINGTSDTPIQGRISGGMCKCLQRSNEGLAGQPANECA